MKYKLYYEEVSISSGMENYNEIKKGINKIWKKCEQEFKDKFYERFSNMDEVIKGVGPFCYQYIDEGIEWGIEFLNKQGVHTIDYDSLMDEFIRKHKSDSPFFLAVEEVEEKYNEIITAQEEMEEYRRDRKENRDRMVGGGYGVEGAIKGAAMAGTMNMASGLAHSTVNFIGNVATSIEASSQKKKLYNSNITIAKYMEGIEVTLLHLTGDIAIALNRNSDFDIEFFGELNGEDTAKAEAYINNIRKGYISKEEILDYCIEALELCPCCEAVYSFLVEHYGDVDGELQDLAEHFGVTVVEEYKTNEIKRQLSEINYYDEKERIENCESFLEWADEYHVEREKYEQVFQEIEELFNENIKVVDGEVYEDKNIALERKECIMKILDRIAGTSGNDVEAIQTLISDIKNTEIKSKEKYIKYLTDELEVEDLRFRNVKNVMYDTRELAQQARKDAFFLDELFVEHNISTKEEAEALMKKVNEIHTEDLRELYLEYLNLCVDIINTQEISNREELVSNMIRKEAAKIFYMEYLCMQKAKCVRSVTEEYKNWYEDLYHKYVTIGEQSHSLENVDEVYFKTVNHAMSYLQYITEKNKDKKSLFSKIKTGVTGVVYKNYEKEYNDITNNGSNFIPEDDVKNDPLCVREIAKASNEEFKEFKKAITEKYKRMGELSNIEDKAMDAKAVYMETKQIENFEIEKILQAVCPAIQLPSRNIIIKNEKDKDEETDRNDDDKDCAEGITQCVIISEESSTNY